MQTASRLWALFQTQQLCPAALLRMRCIAKGNLALYRNDSCGDPVHDTPDQETPVIDLFNQAKRKPFFSASDGLFCCALVEP